MRSGTCIIILSTLILCAPALAYDWSANPGNGTPENPYQISEPNHLIAIGADPNLLDKHFILTNDIIFDPNNNPAHVLDKAPVSVVTSPYEPPTAFNGIFQGNNYTIRNLTFIAGGPGAEYLGLFGIIGQTGIVEDLRLENVNMTFEYAYRIGTIAGENNGSIRRCSTELILNGSVANAGGLVGENYGNIEECRTQITMRIDEMSTSAGGFAALNQGCIVNSFAQGQITGTGDAPYEQRLAGFVVSNENSGIITACGCDVNIVGYYDVAGFVRSNISGVITACYAHGDVTGKFGVAGFISDNGYRYSPTTGAEVIACYSTGTITVTGGDETYSGGFAGDNEGTIYLCFWDKESAGITHSDGGVCKTTAQMKDSASYTGWGYDKVWMIDSGNDFPRLNWENTTGQPIVDTPYGYGGGEGTFENPFIISTSEHLQKLALYRRDFDKHFALANDIALTIPATPETDPANFNVIGTPAFPFTGTLEGQGHSITNLYHSAAAPDPVNHSVYAGLFGCVESIGNQSGMISDLILTSAQMEGHQVIGTLVGKLVGGCITRCGINSSTINCDDCAGGLVGLIEDGVINACYAKGTMQAQQGGGLVGVCRDGVIMTSFSAVVPGSEAGDFGGLVNTAEGISTAFLSYWDSQASSTPSSAIGEGKTTAALMSRQTFKGWGDDIWTLNDNNDYPYLIWESTAGSSIVDMPRSYGGGSGTLNDPYQIWDANDLNTMSWFRNDFDKHFILMSDITLEVPEFWDFPMMNFRPIGTQGVPFSGTFDGNGKTIAGLTYESSNCCAGLFGYIKGTDKNRVCVKDLKLYEVYLGTEGNSIGSIAGCLENGVIQNCITEFSSFYGVENGLVFGNNLVGGLVGRLESGKIETCSYSGEIYGNDEVGGIVGWLTSGTIANCTASGEISGFNMVGGIAGRSGSGRSDVTVLNGVSAVSWSPGNEGGSIEISRCLSDANIDGNYFCGGIAGIHSWGSVNECLADATVIVSKRLSGGLLGGVLNGDVQNCYANTDLQSYFNSGGFLGMSFNGNISHCYCCGSVQNGGSGTMPKPFIDYLYGSNNIESSYFNEILGSYSSVATKLTESQMKQQASFISWDFVGESDNGENEIWRMCEDGVDYPRLSWEFARNGDFACDDGVGLEDLEALGQCWLATVDLVTELDDDTDNIVNLTEMARVGEYWLRTGCDQCGGVDITGDETVDIADLSDILNDWLRTVTPACGTCDANGDEQIDLNDLAVLSENWP